MNKLIFSLIVLSSIVLGTTGTQQAFASTVNISDVPSCVAAGGEHQSAFNECHFDGTLTIPEGDTWNISNFRFSVATLNLEGTVNRPIGIDVDHLTNRGTLTVGTEVVSIGPNNSWLNDCGGTINLLSNTSFRFDASGINHGVINGDATTDINPGSLASNTIFNSGFIDLDIQLIKVIISQISSPCPQAVGGELIPIDTTALLIGYSVLNMYWLAPLGIGIGVGLYLTRNKLKKN